MSFLRRVRVTHVPFPIQTIRRVQTEEGIDCRLVEGYAYVNAIVGDGYDLTRQAMEAATADYNAWGAVREMHQPSAIGRASGGVTILNENGASEVVELGVFWDETGALCRSLVVDGDAVLKLDTGVYKAYSVGVSPTAMRGNVVLSCKWIENSLVDRPADEDARLTLIRLGAPAGDEVEVPDAQEPPVRRSFADKIDMLQNWMVDTAVSDACYELMDLLWEHTRANDRQGDLAAAVQDIDEFCAYLKSLFGDAPGLARAEALFALARTRLSPETDQQLSRFSTLEGDLAQAVQRATTAEAEAATLRAQVAEQGKQIAELEKQPDPKQPVPVRAAPERVVAPFAASPPAVSEDISRLHGLLAKEMERSKTLTTDADRHACAIQINRLRQQLYQLGVVA